MIYIIHLDTELITCMAEGIDEKFISIPYRDCLLKKIDRQLLKIPGLRYLSFHFHYFFFKLKNIAKDDILIFWDFCDSNLLLTLKCKLKGVKNKNVWFWNPVDTVFRMDCEKKIAKLKSMGYEISTFDEEDSLKYKLNIKQQFFNQKLVNGFTDSKDLIYDFYFLGTPKNRLNQIENIEKVLQNKSFVTKFFIINDAKNKISYFENLQFVVHSKCIVDIPQENQVGLTLRVLEALFFHKKLITTMKDISSHKFYTSDNIFIWGVDNIERLSDFLNTPYDHDVDVYLSDYDINQWIRSFKN